MPDPPSCPLPAAWVTMILQKTCMVEGVEGGSGLTDIASAQGGEGAGVQ